MTRPYVTAGYLVGLCRRTKYTAVKGWKMKLVLDKKKESPVVC